MKRFPTSGFLSQEFYLKILAWCCLIQDYRHFHLSSKFKYSKAKLMNFPTRSPRTSKKFYLEQVVLVLKMIIPSPWSSIFQAMIAAFNSLTSQISPSINNRGKINKQTICYPFTICWFAHLNPLRVQKYFRFLWSWLQWLFFRLEKLTIYWEIYGWRTCLSESANFIQ